MPVNDEFPPNTRGHHMSDYSASGISKGMIMLAWIPLLLIFVVLLVAGLMGQ